MNGAQYLALQAVAEYGGLTGSASSGIMGSAVRRGLDVVRLAEENIVVVVAVALGVIVLWRVLTRPAVR